MDVLSQALAKSRQTIRAYEDYADRYDAIVRHVPNEREQASLKRLVAIAGTSGRILEVGSGAGYDADFLEGLASRFAAPTRQNGFSNCRPRAVSTVSFSISSPTISAAPMTPSWRSPS